MTFYDDGSGKSDEAPSEVGTPSAIHAKVAEVMGEIETLEKRGSFKVDGTLRYKFVQATDMYEAIRAKFAQRGVSFLASFVDIVSERQEGKLNTVTVQVSLTLTDSETGGTFSALWAGSGMDHGDKAIPKAFTGAVKSWLMTTFLVPSDTDPDDQGGSAQRTRSGNLTKADKETLVKLLKAGRAGGIADTQLRLKLTSLGARDVKDIDAAAAKLAKDKGYAFMEWLDGELVKRQGGPGA